MRLTRRARGQTLVEFALVFPLFVFVLFGIITFGLGVFYQQQLSNAARDAARYAAVHSSTAQCPTVSHFDPPPPLRPLSGSYARCDRPEDAWPKMRGAARGAIWGISPSAVSLVGCWSGYEDPSGNLDALPSPPNTLVRCTIRATDGGVVDPQADPSSLACPVSSADTTDTASDLSSSGNNQYTTTVTVYACMVWAPPGAGFLMLPSTVTLRATATETMQRQQ
jgi:TadE-like protein